MFTIVDVFAREILDSRGNPTVEAQDNLKLLNCGTAYRNAIWGAA
jgi:enolase